MTHQSSSNDPWLAPYGSAPSNLDAPGQTPYGSIEDAAGATAWQTPSATQPPAVESPPWQAPYAPGASSPWGSPQAGPASVPVAPLYSAPVVGDMPYAWAGLQPQGDPGSLDMPWYGIGIVDAVKRAYVKTFRYDGRASRGEYWWFALALGAVGFALTLLTTAVATTSVGTEAVTMFGWLITLLSLAHVPTGLSLTVRRLHDTGTSGWMCLIALIPYLGSLVLVIMCCLGPNANGIRYDRGAQQPYYPAQPYV